MVRPAAVIAAVLAAACCLVQPAGSSELTEGRGRVLARGIRGPGIDTVAEAAAKVAEEQAELTTATKTAQDKVTEEQQEYANALKTQATVVANASGLLHGPDPMIRALVVNGEQIAGQIHRTNDHLATTETQLAALKASLTAWQVPLKALAAAVKRDVAQVDGSGKALTGLTAAMAPIPVTLASVRQQIKLNIATAKVYVAKTGGNAKKPPKDNINDRIAKANETLYMNGTEYKKIYDRLVDMEDYLDDNATELAMRSVRHAQDEAVQETNDEWSAQVKEAAGKLKGNGTASS